jgi:hypothetical protein
MTVGIKVVVGQIWEFNKQQDNRYTISAIDNNGKHCRAYDANGNECSFWYLDEQGCAKWIVNDSSWKVVGDVFDGAQVPYATTAAINDYTCPTCHNTRCSKSEGKCWSCGNNL